MDDQTRKTPEKSPEMKDLPPKKVAKNDKEAQNVKGGSAIIIPDIDRA